MGTSVCIECESCKYSKSLLEGIGMLYDDLDYLIGIMEPRQKEEVLAIRENHYEIQFEPEMKIFACPQCKTLSNHLDLKLEYGTSGTYQTQYSCGLCGSSLATVKNPVLSDYVCPYCGKKAISESSLIAGELWD